MPLNVLRDIRKIYSGLNADSVRDEAWRDLNVGLLASDESGYKRMESFLAPSFMEKDARNQASDGAPERGSQSDRTALEHW